MPADSCCLETQIADAIKNTVTPHDVAVVSRRALDDPTVQVLEYHLDDYSADRLGFLGSHRQLEIKVKRKNNSEPEKLNLFVKSIPYDCQRQASFVKDGIFDEEYNFFSKIAPHLLEDYDDERWGPNCYLAKSDSFIMEDLRCRGFKMRATTFDGLPEVKSALSAIARFHACSILTEARLSRASKRTVTLKEQYPNSFGEKIFRHEGPSYKWVQSGTNIAYLIAEKLGLNSRVLRKGYDSLFEVIKQSSVHRNVICHGDLWTNNLMFDETKPQPVCVLVDYQIVRYAPQVLDVLMIIYLHTSSDFRKAHENELIAYYHSVLEKTIRNNSKGKDVKVPTLHEVKLALNDLRVFGPAIASLYFPLVLMDPEVLKEKTKDSEGFDDFVFGDRVDVSLNYFDNNEVFRKKVQEVIKELAEICEKM